MSHTCHWPGCQKDVPPSRWGCSSHWYKLPKDIRDRIWRAYIPGQEITKTPSEAYLAVAREAEAFARGYELERRASSPAAPVATPQPSLF